MTRLALLVACAAATASSAAASGGVRGCYVAATFPRYTACEAVRNDSLSVSWAASPPPLLQPQQAFAVTWTGLLTLPTPANVSFSVIADGGAYVRLRVDDHPLIEGQVVSGPSSSTRAYYPVPVPAYSLGAARIFVEYVWTNASSQPPGSFPTVFSLLMDVGDGKGPLPLPPSALSPALPDPDAAYLAAREENESGWGTFYSNDLLTFALLPEGIAVRVAFRTEEATATAEETGEEERAASQQQRGPDTPGTGTVSHVLTQVGADGPSCNTAKWPVQLGLHSVLPRLAYSELAQVQWRGWVWRVEAALLPPNSSSSSDGDIAIVVTTLAAPSSPSAVPAFLDASFYVPPEWAPRWCGVTGSATPPSLAADCPTSPSKDPLLLLLPASDALQPTLNASTLTLTLPLPSSVGSAAALYTQRSQSGSTPIPTAALAAAAAAARASLVANLTAAYGPDDNNTAAGLAASVAWNVVFSPLEGLVVPVFRGNPWGLSGRGYVLFLWDTFLTAYLAAAAGDAWAAAQNVIRMVKSVTPGGEVLGHWEGTCGELNSKPPLASGAALAVARSFPDVGAWLVPLLTEQLVSFNRWWDRTRFVPASGGAGGGDAPTGERLLAPGALTLGNASYACSNQKYDGLTGSKFETGLDNSPLFDNATFLPSTHTMNQVDVGLSALYARDAQILGGLAASVGRVDWAAEVWARGNATDAAIDSILWDADALLWLNREWEPANGTGGAVGVAAPPCFYPLLTGTPSGADRLHPLLSRWLANASEFCVVADAPASCGPVPSLPSVTRTQPSFGDNDYWRGRAWGPMSFLTYSGLARYADAGDPAASAAASALAEQARASFLVNWAGQGHVMENMNSEKGEGCDSGRAVPFYTWGALHALIGLDARGKLPEGVQGVLRA
jgi:hypothetical protein